MAVLASADDVAAALGLPNAAAIPAAQSARLPGELARVTRAWENEAGRSWVAGPVRVQVSVVGGWITLPDAPTDDPEVTTRDGDPVTVDVSDGSTLRLSVDGCRLVSGTIVNVTYTAPGVPPAVTASVAGVVARRLGISPGSAETKFTELTAGADFRAKAAEWVSSTSVLTPDEAAEARSYRPAASTVIIARWR